MTLTKSFHILTAGKPTALHPLKGASRDQRLRAAQGSRRHDHQGCLALESLGPRIFSGDTSPAEATCKGVSSLGDSKITKVTGPPRIRDKLFVREAQRRSGFDSSETLQRAVVISPLAPTTGPSGTAANLGVNRKEAPSLTTHRPAKDISIHNMLSCSVLTSPPPTAPAQRPTISLFKAAYLPYVPLFPHLVKFLANTMHSTPLEKDYDSIYQHSHQSTRTTGPQGWRRANHDHA